MKKRKLLTALLLCTAMSLQVNAENVSDWQGVTQAFHKSGNYTLTESIANVVIVPDIEEDGTESSNSAFFGDESRSVTVNFDMNGKTISGGNSTSPVSPFDVGDLFGEGYNKGELSITNGTISNFSGFKSDMPSAGTISSQNSPIIKQLSVDFTNNSNDFGGAISNITGSNASSKSVINNVSGVFTSNKANYLGGAIYNTGLKFKAAFDGSGNATFSKMEITRDLASKISITTNGKNTVFNGNSADIAGGAIFNNGTVDISAKDGNSVIFQTATDTIYNNGVLNFNSGEIVVNSEISDKEINVAVGNLMNQKIGGEGVTNIKDGATLTLGNGATITQKEINVNGSLYAENGGTITGALKIGSTGTADLNPSNLTSAVSNDGDIALWDGALSQNINGNGTTAILGEVTNNAVITQKTFGIEKEDGFSNGIFTTNLDNLKIADKKIHNYGTLILTGGTNEYEITSTDTDGSVQAAGLTVIKGDVTNNSQIKQAVEIQSGKLTSNSDNINSVKIGSGATYDVIGGALTDSITGSGHLQLSNDFTSVAMANFTGDVNVAEGNTLTVGNALFNNNTLTMSNGSTLSLLGEAAKDVTIDKLAIASGDVVNLKFDWGDTLNSSSSEVKGSFNVTEINLASTDGTESTYTFTNLGNKVALDSKITLSNVTEQTNNFVTYNNTNGALFSKRRTLAGAVDETEATETNTYVMSGNETAGNETLTGTLTVQGNGNAITNGGITVGDGTTTGSVLTLKDVNFDNIKVEGDSKGAIHVNGGNELSLVAEAADLTVKGSTGNSTSAIYLQKDETNGAAKATINALGGTITISDDIMSNDKDNQIIFAGNKNIKFSGKFDPVLATVNMSGAELERSGQDIDIDWNLNGGTLKYTNDNFLSGGTNSINFNGGSLDLRNGVVSNIDLAGFTLSKSSNLYLDADLANKTMDSFNTENISVADNFAKLHVAGFNLISDATEDKTTINFVPKETNLTGYVDYTGKQGITALSPIYKYNVDYDETNGDFNFTRFATGGGYNSYNPAVMASPVAAQLGGYLTQLNSYDEAFRNMDMYMLMTKKQREAMKLRNKYAAADSNLIFDPTGTPYNDKAVWARPYATFENVSLKGGPKVSNVAYGSFFGGESELYDLGHGWDGMYGIYAGYNGSHQAYDGIGIYQNGGTLGLVGMAYKGNYFVGATINAGANVGEANTAYGTDNFTMLMAGIAAKTGYNVELADGKFIIQPNFQMSYSFVNTFDYTNAAGVRMDSSPLSAIQFEPGIKFIGNLKNGWQPYAGVSVVWNVMDKTNFNANNVSLPELSVKPYVRYGLGVRKTWGEVCTGFFQTYFTNGGRNGVGLQAGFRFTLGKGGLSSLKTSNNMPELPATKIMLSNGGR